MQTALYELGCIYLEWGLLDDARRALKRADELGEAMQDAHMAFSDPGWPWPG